MAVKMSVNLSDDAARTLKNLADENGVTITEELRSSISTELWLTEVERLPARFLWNTPMVGFAKSFFSDSGYCAQQDALILLTQRTPANVK